MGTLTDFVKDNRADIQSVLQKLQQRSRGWNVLTSVQGNMLQDLVELALESIASSSAPTFHNGGRPDDGGMFPPRGHKPPAYYDAGLGNFGKTSDSPTFARPAPAATSVRTTVEVPVATAPPEDIVSGNTATRVHRSGACLSVFGTPIHQADPPRPDTSVSRPNQLQLQSGPSNLFGNSPADPRQPDTTVSTFNPFAAAPNTMNADSEHQSACLGVFGKPICQADLPWPDTTVSRQSPFAALVEASRNVSARSAEPLGERQQRLQGANTSGDRSGFDYLKSPADPPRPDTTVSRPNPLKLRSAPSNLFGNPDSPANPPRPDTTVSTLNSIKVAVDVANATGTDLDLDVNPTADDVPVTIALEAPHTVLAIESAGANNNAPSPETLDAEVNSLAITEERVVSQPELANQIAALEAEVKRLKAGSAQHQEETTLVVNNLAADVAELRNELKRSSKCIADHAELIEALLQKRNID